MLFTSSKPSLGDFRKLVFLFFPILMMTFSSFLFLFVEKLLLASFSVEAMEAAVSSAYACQIFQAPCVALAMMCQVFVGRWYGGEQWKEIGPAVWQFLWFSFLSSLLIIPLGILYGHYYFQGTIVEKLALPYYYFLIFINFLFPLGTTLSCFFLGQGKTRLILFCTIGFQAIKLVLGYLLIFGWDNWIPSLGIMGGAVSTFIAQLGFSLVLLSIFLNKNHAENFCSRIWHFQPLLFWECIQPGFLRALNRLLNFASWAAIAHLMTVKNGNFILSLSIGGTLFLFLPFLSDAICQAQTTIVSQILGKNLIFSLRKAFHSGIILVLLIVSIIAIPFLIFPFETFYLLFKNISPEGLSIPKIFLGVWICFLFYTLLFVPLSSILAFKDTKFSLFMGIFSWINGYALMALAIKTFDIAADQFWLVLSIMHVSNALLYYLRMRWLHAKELKSNQLQLADAS